MATAAPEVSAPSFMTQVKEQMQVQLIPWDADNEEHVKRLFDQRVACGWKQDMVGSWKEPQKSGAMALHFVVPAPSAITTSSILALHISTYPEAKQPILDTAETIFGRPRTPSLLPFIPVGHISLDSAHASPEIADPSKHLYAISTFYISRALHRTGLGSAALEELEVMAATGLGAKALALDTITRELNLSPERNKGFGRPIPKVAVQDWYAKRGYLEFARLENAWSDVDLTGRVWQCSAVMMKKDLKQQSKVK